MTEVIEVTRWKTLDADLLVPCTEIGTDVETYGDVTREYVNALESIDECSARMAAIKERVGE